MLSIKILGSGCANCKRLEELTRQALDQIGTVAELFKVTDPVEYLDYGVMTTPGLVINGTVVSSGRVPSVSEIVSFLKSEYAPD